MCTQKLKYPHSNSPSIDMFTQTFFQDMLTQTTFLQICSFKKHYHRPSVQAFLAMGLMGLGGHSGHEVLTHFSRITG